MKYSICPDCGAHLDFGEICDCQTQAGTNGDRKGGECYGGIETGGRTVSWDGNKAVGMG